MSDIAPFVAAAIRDRVIADLQKENERLTAQIHTTRIVSAVCGPFSASTNFSDGRREDTFWSIRFTAEWFPLTILGDLKVYVGGILFAEIDCDHVAGLSSLDTLGEVRFLELELRNCWITLSLCNVTKTSLDSLQHASLENFWNVLMGPVKATNPDATVRVQEVSLDVNHVPGLMTQVPMNLRDEVAKYQRIQAQTCLRTIVTRLKQAFPHEESSTLLLRGRHIQELLYAQGIQTNQDPRFGSAMNMILLHGLPSEQGGRT